MDQRKRDESPYEVFNKDFSRGVQWRDRRAESGKGAREPAGKASFQDQRFGYFAARSRKPVCVRGGALCMCMCVGVISS